MNNLFNLTLTSPPPQEQVLSSGRLLIGPLAHPLLQSLQGEIQRAVSQK